MIKSVLIPIDFNVESLNSLKIALANGKGKRVKVTLLYGYALSDSITELLFYSASKITRSLMNPEFEEAITIIESRFESMIDSISIELFHGLNTTAFINLIKAKNIDMIYIPKSYQLNIY
ncbi:MAG: hypothetical protein R2822_25055 [Spirosomataceae bacterium]